MFNATEYYCVEYIAQHEPYTPKNYIIHDYIYHV